MVELRYKSKCLVPALVVLLVCVFAGCSGLPHPYKNYTPSPPVETPTPSKPLNLSKEIWATCKKIEGDLWNLVKANGTIKILLIVDNNTKNYIDLVKGSVGNYEVLTYNYSELNASMKKAVWRVLAFYGLPEKLPIIIAVKPPVLYISTGGNAQMPDPVLLQVLEEYHPASFFSGKGEAIAFIVNNPKLVNETIDIATKLERIGKKVVVYYNVDRYGFASSKVINKVLNISGDCAVIAKDGLLEKVLPLDKALEELRRSIEESSNATAEAKAIVYFVYSPTCPHCENVKPYIEGLAANYTDVKFVFCDVTNPSDECRVIIDKYNIEFVPTVIVKMKNEVRMLVGEDEIKMLGEILNATKE